MLDISAIQPAVSLPVRERGLKYFCGFHPPAAFASLPVRERGLKCRVGERGRPFVAVAPCAGAWIEIYLVSVCLSAIDGRSLCGSVD